MPTYQYVCTRCAHQLEAVQSFNEASLRDCTECSGSLRKVFSSVGVVFKGSGFYRNDSRDTAGKSSHDANGSQQPKSGDKDTTTKGADAKDTTAKETKTPTDKSATPTTAKAPAASGSS